MRDFSSVKNLIYLQYIFFSLSSFPSLFLKVALTEESKWNRSLNVWLTQRVERVESTAADGFCFLFFLFVCRSLPVWVDKSAWCLFYGQKEQARWKKHQAAVLYPFHAWTCGSSPAPGGTSCEHLNRDQKKSGWGQLYPANNCISGNG